jgi:transcriptional regulator with XRE-family HTH domain
MLKLALSLEDYRRNRYRTVEEFAGDLGISASTYYRMLNGRSEIATMRRVAALLGVPLTVIAEFTPPASPTLLAQITAAVDHADQYGWRELDPETIELTGERRFEPFPAGEDRNKC